MEDCHRQSDFLFSNSCVACCFIMAEGQRWLFRLGGERGGGVLPECQVDRNFIAATPKKKIYKIQR